MARHLKIMICLLSGLALLPAAAGCAQAAGNVTAPGVLLQQNELQMMQNRLQRQQYQQNQQIIREIDRQAPPQAPPRQPVPVIKPGCQGQVFGNTYTGTNCR